MLREGPMQRCMSCGQVYKLVRLRDEFSDEMDYYKTSTVPLEHHELGEADHWHQFNPLRVGMPTWEHTLFETKSNSVYSLVNPDDHDRILVDPAYRLEKLQTMEDKAQVFQYSLHLIDESYKQDNPEPARPVNMNDYENLVEAEMSIERVDRALKRGAKFNARAFLDAENHERREKRMSEGKRLRTLDSYTVYFGGLTEDEAQYRDYFETDLEANPDNEQLSEHVIQQRILDREEFKLSTFDFQEMHTLMVQEDASGMVKKKLFEFKYRRAKDSPVDYTRKEQRVLERSMSRLTLPESKALFENLAQARIGGNELEIESAEKDVLRFFADEGRSQFLDYYESDSDEVNTMLQALPQTDIGQFIDVMEDYAKNNSSIKGYQSIQKRKWNQGLGFWSNIKAEIADYRGFVAPRIEKLENQLHQLDAEIYSRDLTLESHEKVDLLN